MHNESEVTWGWREVAFVLASTLLAAGILGMLGGSLSAAMGWELAGGLVSPALYITGTAIYLSAVGAIYLFAARHAGWAALGVKNARPIDYLLVPPIFLLEITALIAVNLVVAQLAGGFDNPQVESISGGNPLSRLELIMLFLLIAGLVPLVEELFFRGMLYPLLRQRMGAFVAITLNAAIFAAVHVFPLLLPGLFVVGLFLAYLRERSGSIWPSVLLHALQNGLALLAISATLV
ncbi:MAG: CPBP family intramembrane metalloprotease [Candidatus Viridilinea halotolerans]|uniref:CPBP family intramembrane metalloprotease n=1 Tax=Candidatus Viridilinea halotolerans TaxID=2491704 RepID=A0A426TZ98_9CHLR|nr:MAG: CPBP family intramembrane metalloprotease [Candidatus Viridilinea halotolerans]